MLAAIAELLWQLGRGVGRAEACNLSVRELPPTDWGYDGVTQWERKRSRELVGA
jgi:hypothetical protein